MKHPHYVWRSLSHYLIFFALVAFVITCCMTLFVTVLSATLKIELTGENLGAAAKLTFANVLLLSAIFTFLDWLRRRLTVERPVRQIITATERMMQGDFHVRVKPITKFATDKSFNMIAECFNKMAAELSGIETLRTDFIANVSHEMKTPLAVMQNYATLLGDPALPAETRAEYAATIAQSARRLSNMMTNVLKLNRLENQQIYPAITRFDLGEQLGACLLQYEDTWERKHIELDAELAEDVFIRADKELLFLVWNNLFSNAFKFTDEGGSVSVTLSATDTHATVTVRDTGCGITPEVGAHIFDKFYQGDTSHATEGNGLGLALVKRVVDITNGEIRVESTVGAGTSFTVTLKKENAALPAKLTDEKE